MVKHRFNVGSGWYEVMVKNQVVGPNRLVFGSIVKFFCQVKIYCMCHILVVSRSQPGNDPTHPVKIRL